jgi:hypothetical protein
MKCLSNLYVADKSKSTPSSFETGAVQTMEDYQLPTKFKRVMMEDAEINAINVCKLKQIII